MIESVEQLKSTAVAPRGLRAKLLARTQREAFRASKPLRSALPFLVSSLAVGALSIFFSLYTPCYQLSVNGLSAGLVQSQEQVQQVAGQVEDQLSLILARDYQIALDYDYDFTIAPKDHLASYSVLSEAMYAAVEDVKPAYVLTVDGKELAASGDKQVLDRALKTVETPFVSDQTQEVFFANEARITRKYIPAEHAFSQADGLVEALRQPVVAGTIYEVRAGDSVQSLLSQFQMTQEQFLALNPKMTPETKLMQGQLVTVEKTLPLLSVGTVETVSYERMVESPRREVADANRYEGEEAVLVRGDGGSQLVTARLTKVNGVTQYEEVLSQIVTKEASETVVAVGTKERPAYYSTGSLQWPCQGRITSPFGYRSIFGGTSFHSGMDIANAYGTTIYAADSGIVSYVGYKGSYGNLVIIDHGNGWETYYSHGSANHVSVGQGVSKGDLIASMGATGRATGNHCHFELRIHGEPVNPAAYLP